ncbi:MAG: hypothetical protein OZSIB_1777 [Candidatus Ozemobacter sibiricus]|uniref:Uncharacterized protein n=1 Tax=Candidatus Ozemobacter sibiricus TaxID=2268124 RepID=A0A367ZJB1_9BACT|nr:MAG: hypothetical protein OZSIB_1777 [Candidatus Ozemobacter sibiricus]
MAVLALNPEWPALFESQLREAIVSHAICPDLFRRLTLETRIFTQEDVDWRLRELWQAVYGTPLVEEMADDP